MAVNWKQMVPQDSSKLLSSYANAGKELGNSIQGLGDTVTKYAKNREDRETDAFVTDLMAMGSDEERQQAIVAANTSFLDMGRVGESTYKLGEGERALETALATEKRNLKDQKTLYRFEDKIKDANRDEEYSNQEKIIDKEAGIASDAAGALGDVQKQIKIEQADIEAAKAIGLAELGSKEAINLAKLKEIAAVSKRADEAEAKRLENVNNQKRGIEKIRFKLTGGDDNITIGMNSTDVESHGVLGVALKKYGISDYQWQKWSGDNMAWTTDNKNGFNFNSRGTTYKFESSNATGTNLNKIIGDVVAAIKFDEKDQATKAAQWAIWQAPTGSKGSKNKNATVPLDARNNYSGFESFYDEWASTQDATKQINANDFWKDVKSKTTQDITRMLLDNGESDYRLIYR